MRSALLAPSSAGRTATKPIHVLIALDPRFHYDRCALQGIAQRAEAHAEVFIDAKPLFMSLEDAVHRGGYAGIIATTAGDRDVETLASTKLPCVNIANYLYAHDRVPVVGNDDKVVGKMAADYFTSRGFRRCACYYDGANQYFDIRRQSFYNAAVAAGASCEFGPSTSGRHDRYLGSTEDAAKWLIQLKKPVGILAPFDDAARQLIEACILAGLRVPEEVSVIGVDNDPFFCVGIRPTLSSVATAATQIGYAAMKQLLAMIAGEPPPQKPLLFPPTEVVERGSTAEAAIDDPDVAAAIHYIRAHLRHRLTVANIADHVAISRRTLERKFADSLSRSPLFELRRQRVEQAKRMLANTDLELTEVARLSGFTHTARLSNLIKRFTGVTPRQFRIQNSQNGQ